jgi:predicted GTPase
MSGKSTIGLIIADALREKGLNVVVDPHPDYKSEEQMRSRHVPERIDAVVNRTNLIRITEQQVNRKAIITEQGIQIDGELQKNS